MARRLLVLFVLLLAIGAAPGSALAAITGTVYMDYNSNGANDAGGFVSGSSVAAADVGVGGVTVNAYDATGTRVSTATTATNGTYTICSSGCSGTVRLEFSIPTGYQPSFRGANNGTSVRFVSSSATGVDFAVTRPTQYCQDNPLLVTCMFPIADSQTAIPSEFGGFSFPASMSGAAPLTLTDAGKTIDSDGADYATPTTVASGRAIGAAFGVGVDRSRNIYYGAYVKRHSEYALDANGTPRTGLNVYRVNLADASIATSLTPWVTLGINTMPAHSAANPSFVTSPSNNFPYAADGNRSLSSGQPGYSAVYENVGRAGLGDVDVSPDGTKLYAIEMTQGAPKFWEVPINGTGASATAGTPVSTALTAPSTFNGVACWGQWHPMGIGVRDEDVLIGGVCGGEGKLQPLPLRPTAVIVASRVVTVTTATAHGLDVGDYVSVVNLYTNANGVQLVTAVTATTFTYTSAAATAPVDTAGSTPPNTASVSPDIPGGRFTARSRSGNIATITTTANHDLSVGDWVTVSGAGGSGYTGLVRITAVTSNTFSYGSTGADEATFSITAGSARRESAPVAAFIQRRNGAGGFDTVAAFSLGYPKAITNGSGAQAAGGTGFEWELGSKTFSGVWRVWNDVPPPSDYGTNLSSTNPFQGTLLSSGNDAGSFGQPMLANIEIMDDGSLVVALRDRYMDQVSLSDTLNYERTTETLLNQGQGAAEIVKVCKSGSTYTMETAGACGADTGAGATGGTPIITGTGMTSTMRDPSALYYWNAFFGTEPSGTFGSNTLYITHAYTGLGGTASLPGSKTLWSTSYDVDSANQQGIKVFGPCAARAGDGSCGPANRLDGAIIGGAGFRLSLAASSDKYSFKKGNGLGDLELVCDAAPVQIGNYVWIDTNRNGIQDPDEARVQGVTVRLYDATNTLVGTAITDANGQYYFASNVTESASGNGDNAGGGLTTGQAFTVRVDNPADYAAGGPLVPYLLTSATQTSPGTGSSSISVDSNAVLAAGYPQISVSALSAGQNNHTYDVGFVTPTASSPVAVGDIVWVDANGNGAQDAGEQPLAGVVVALLNPDGTPANDINGSPVSTATTDAQGRYLFDNLAAGSYKVQFTLPTGYTFTVTGGGTAATDSNPSPGVNPLVGTTPVFAVSAIPSGDTVADTDSSTVALRVNPTIDAGVVPPGGGSGGGGSGGGGSGGGGSGGGGSGGGGSGGGGSGSGSGSSGGGSGGSGGGSVSAEAAPSTPAMGSDLTGRGPNGTNTNGVSGGPGSANPVPGANSGALVGVGDLVWFDTNRNGVQDRGERPMRGARVIILNADGSRARDANGRVISQQVTDANGNYFFANLQPGRYKMKFIYPDSYIATTPNRGKQALGSNASPTSKRNVAITPAFIVAGIPFGETSKAAAVGQRKAAFANPSIDAGVVPPWAQLPMGAESVTG